MLLYPNQAASDEHPQYLYHRIEFLQTIDGHPLNPFATPVTLFQGWQATPTHKRSGIATASTMMSAEGIPSSLVSLCCQPMQNASPAIESQDQKLSMDAIGANGTVHLCNECQPCGRVSGL